MNYYLFPFFRQIQNKPYREISKLKKKRSAVVLRSEWRNRHNDVYTYMQLRIIDAESVPLYITSATRFECQQYRTR